MAKLASIPALTPTPTPTLTCLLTERVPGAGLRALVMGGFKSVDGVEDVKDGCTEQLVEELVEDESNVERVEDGDADALVEYGCMVELVGDGDADELVEDGGAEELVETKVIILAMVLDGAYPTIVCIIAGPNENKRDGVEQHPKESEPRQQ